MRSTAIAVAAVLLAPGSNFGNPDREPGAFLAVHNAARAAVGAPPLQWNSKLAAYAQDWAKQLARSGRFEHRPDNPYGENLAGYHSPHGPEYGARLWLDEKKDYHGEVINGHNFRKFGHYTQMVWRESTHVGYGLAQMPDGMWILVANYEPAGNVIGERPYK
jgi:pathogenesis-related protein 1